ncbi:MAG: S8 family serine peptidase [Pseudomonadota bacterium]
MKKILLVGALSVASPFSAQAEKPLSAQPAEMVTSNRLLIMPRAGLSPKNLEKILAVYTGQGRKIGKSNLHLVDLPPGVLSKIVLEALKRHPHLKFVEEDRLVKATAIPNDPYFGSQWHTARINAPIAWDRTLGAGVTIAIIDSGVNSSHPDLAANMVQGYNFVENNTNTTDVCNHGTLVAGAAAGVSNNGTGIAGVAGRSRIMPIKIAYLDPASNSCLSSYSAIAKGITHAADNGARIVNVSFGPIADSPAIQSAAQYLKSKGGLLFISAGNAGINESFARNTAMIPVAATDTQDVKPGWSNYGNFIALSAPGTGIWTTTGTSGYQEMSGTSFSSPVAAGVGALMMAVNPALNNLTIEQLLYSTAVDLGSPGVDTYYGYGRVNAGAAVAAAASRIVAVDTQPPSVSINAPVAGSTVAGLVAVNVVAGDNIGVARVELRVNGRLVVTDSTLPFGLTWDSAGASNGTATLIATAYDAKENQAVSTPVAVTVANNLPATSETWTNCATEGGVCNVAGARQVRYGANNSYAYRNATNSISCTNAVFGDPMYGTFKSCQVSGAPTVSTTPAVATWSVCATENGSCSFTGTREVRYGANGAYVGKIFTGTTACTNQVFGDPAYGTTKSCWFSSTTR